MTSATYLVTRRFRNWEGAARVWFWTGKVWTRLVEHAEVYYSWNDADRACVMARRAAVSDPSQVQVEVV